MYTDKYGQIVLNETDLCDAFFANPDIQIKNALVEKSIYVDEILGLDNFPNLITYVEPTSSLEEFDNSNQNNWFLPKEYHDMDIAKYILDLCKTEEELQRAGDELIKFQERNMFTLLKYLKYLVDVMRQHNIVWGVGRGSSVSSYVLYLLGVHKINSLYYDLSIDEFLK